jgi:hypothetical protein
LLLDQQFGSGLIWSAALFRRFFHPVLDAKSKAAEKRRTPNEATTNFFSATS